MDNRDTLPGLAFAMASYLLWGFLPFYMKAVAHISPAEVVAHRVLWSIPVAGALLVVTGRTAQLRAALASPRALAMAAVTAVFLSANWGIYVWAIGAGRVLDTALGYYINPLFSVLLGASLLGERLGRAQILALALAALAVAILTWDAGHLPLPALGLMFTWGIYAYLKRRLPIEPNQGFMLEACVLLPFALAYLGWLTWRGEGHFALTLPDTALLLGLGPVTAVPLILYANGAKRLRLSTIGILQYSAPTIIFLMAVFWFAEPFGQVKFAAFALIWVALAIYSAALIAQARNRT